MKFKYKIKVYKKNIKKNNNVIFGDLILNNKIENIYIMKNNLINKIFKNNFLIIKFLKKKYFTFIKIIKYSPINNKIEYFIIEQLKEKFNFNYFNINNKLCKKIIFLNNNFYPRKIHLLSLIKKKILTEKNFCLYNFKTKNNKLFYNKS